MEKANNIIQKERNKNMEKQNICIRKLLPNQEIEINDEMHTAEDDGVLMISRAMMFGSKLGLNEFEQAIAEVLDEKQQMKLYGLWGGSGSIVLKTTVQLLGGDRGLAQQVIEIGIEHGILGRGTNSSWKVLESMIKQRMITMKKYLMDRVDSQPVVSQMDAVKKLAGEIQSNKEVERKKKQVINKKK